MKLTIEYFCVKVNLNLKIATMSSTKFNSTDFESGVHSQWLETAGNLYKNESKKLKKELSLFGLTKRRVNVSGFDIYIDDDSQAKAFRAKIVQEAEDRKKIRDKLKNAGITPIAILPADIFHKLLAKSDFFIFHRISSDGNVPAMAQKYINTLSFSSGESSWKFIFLAAYFLITIIVGVCAFIGMYTTIGIACSISVVLQLIALITTDDSRTLSFARICYYIAMPAMFPIRFFHRRIVKNKIKDLLWPTKEDSHLLNEVVSNTQGGVDFVKIVLPEPPAAIKSKLKICYDQKIATSLVVHRNAFQVVINNEIEKVWYDKYADPIICHYDTETGMVAVIDQFGDFPEEKAVIEYISEHFDAVRRNLLSQQAN